MLTATLDARDPGRLADFWAGMLGREIAGAGVPVGLRFVAERGPGAGPGRRLHPHLTSADLADQQQTVATALRLGGRHLDVGQRPEEGHVVLADPEGNEFVVRGD
ncbi:VOC family protein [Actinoplanes sp. NPDC051851]|uniref:VOC family protein n=1 Tax=Actinoplanes sp. NPDC051851 TaxID=3154753 RepID=UPI0034460EBA